jgi:short-subunit dehydrogenase
MNKNGLVVVTGASSGIGRAFVLTCIDAGLRVAATARNVASLSDIASKCTFTAALDVTDASSIDAFAAQILSRKETVSVLINNAGYGAFGPLAEMPRKNLSDQFETNVVGALHMVSALFPFMVKNSVVVQIGSVSGEVVTPWAGAYCASKAALHALSDALRMELTPFGIHVLTVKPGGVVSHFGERATVSAQSILKQGSQFAAFRKGIELRSNESQTKPARAEDLVKAVLKAVIKKKPPRELRFGPMSRSLVVFKKLIPQRMYDWIKMKRYGLK